MAKGKVKWYNVTKGFGFIAKEDGKDIFVHRTGIDRAITALEPDQEVSFDEQDGQKGIMAVNVKLI
ncbi:MAG: Cold shock-like protein CspLA [Bacteroidetes bacterium ADurb.Bin217]|nr:MAG: Cold shock-like protein CspLA [Bacteroidetes bacterium ADurb.Bin217]